jgi:hypothetical protein
MSLRAGEGLPAQVEALAETSQCRLAPRHLAAGLIHELQAGHYQFLKRDTALCRQHLRAMQEVVWKVNGRLHMAIFAPLRPYVKKVMGQ